MNTSITSVPPPTPSPQEVQPRRGYGVNALAPLLNPVQLQLIQTTVRAYVQEQSVATRLEALSVLEAQNDGVAGVEFELTSLLQLLSWRRLVDASSMSDEQLKQLLDDMLSSAEGQTIGRRLNTVLGWYGAADNESIDPMVIRQLVWKALILELDPPEHRQPGYIAGYEFGKPENWGRPLTDIQKEFEDFLEEKTCNAQGGRSSHLARLAAYILAPIAPEMVIKETPGTLRYGNGEWVNFAHGVALVEALSPGSSPTMSYEQLLALPLKMFHSATGDERNIIIQTRIAPALQWAVVNGVLPVRASPGYSPSEIQTAIEALDAHQNKVVTAIGTLLSKAPYRPDIGLKKFNEVLGAFNAKALLHLTMRPTTFWKRVEYSLRNPSPRIPSGEFYLLDVFVAGFMKNGTDQFEPVIPSHLVSQKEFYENFYNEQIEHLKGIDVDALYRKAFEQYVRDAQSAYSCMVEKLIAEIPYADRRAIQYGTVYSYALEQPTGKRVDEETRQDRQLTRGRAGFVLVCRQADNAFAYEMFPLLGIAVRNPSLSQLPDGNLILKPRLLRRRAGPLPLDWEAYEKFKAPRANIKTNALPVRIYTALPGRLEAVPLTSPLSSPRFKGLGHIVAKEHLFFNQENWLKENRSQTGSEFVSANYPPVLRMLATFIPGLSCFNAVQNDEAPAISCAIDVGLILASPAFKFAKGFVSLALNAGAPVIARRLPALAKLTGNFVSDASASYLRGLNPFDGLFYRVGPFSGMAALLLKSTYKLHEAVGQTLGKPGEFAYINGLESAASPDKWRPIAIGDRLATMINGVADVPVRDFPTVDGSVRTYLVNTASGYSYGPALAAELLRAAPAEGADDSA
ncbi:hypothetical protein [Pseudomonas sp. Irchel 3A5]|uniref:hypothetical protein n=1 Tax=Pseudomonas sp. Irchel 3A5 TaxID=2008911 RepID=UPI0011406C78|nr:hypothetical protein [Pseudomonas sp. Irchel 3A5]